MRHFGRVPVLPGVVLFAGVLLCVVLAACGQDTPIGIEAGAPPVATFVSGRETPTPRPKTGSARGTPTPRADIPLTRVPEVDIPLPNCAPPVENVVALPKNFPRFPFPAGTKITNAWQLNNDPNSLQVLGYSPKGLFESLNYLIVELPKQGYVLGYGDQESNEAESQFSGNGWRGAFVIRSVYECEGVSMWRVVMLKQ